jgi:hypothetical protein
MKIEGILCRIRDQHIVDTVQKVLQQIAKKAPEDFKRIQKMVTYIGWLPLRTSYDKFVVGRYGNKDKFYEFRPGPLFLSRRIKTLSENDRIAVIAHELGHAATTEEDFWIREEESGGEGVWASELCANRLAYKWGFGRHIRNHHRHFPEKFLRTLLPGDTVIVEDREHNLKATYHVTRGFHIKVIIEPLEDTNSI